MQWDIHGLILLSPQFISTGQNSVAFRVVKEIKCGDELTAYYGNHYYGENNYDCRCATCERWAVVPWLPTGFLLWGGQMTNDWGYYRGYHAHTRSLSHTHRQGEGYFSINHETTDNVSMGEKEDGKMKASRKRKSAIHQEGKHQCRNEVYFSHAEITLNAVPFRLSCGCFALWSGTAWACY